MKGQGMGDKELMAARLAAQAAAESLRSARAGFCFASLCSEGHVIPSVARDLVSSHLAKKLLSPVTCTLFVRD